MLAFCVTRGREEGDFAAVFGSESIMPFHGFGQFVIWIRGDLFYGIFISSSEISCWGGWDIYLLGIQILVMWVVLNGCLN